MLTRPKTHCGANFSASALSAIVSAAGLGMSIPSDGTNDYGVDVSIKSVTEFGGKYRDEGELFDIQIKSTRAWRPLTDGKISVTLEVEAYLKLKAKLPNRKRLLVVMLLPIEDDEEWVDCSYEKTSLMRALFFKDVDHLDFETENRNAVTVHLEGEDLLNPEKLKLFARGVYRQLHQDVGETD